MESPKSPELKPKVFLYGPSKSEAIRLGLGSWFKRLSSHEEVTTVEGLDLVNEGIFISFNPIRVPEDAFPQLGERVRRWICIEDDDSFPEGCRIAKEEGVDRIIHARLIDEMRCPVIPSTILLLRDRGIWLPDTDFEESSNLSFPLVKKRKERAEKLILFLIEEEILEGGESQILLGMLERGVSFLGYQSEIKNLQHFASGSASRLPSQIVLLSDQAETVLKIARWAKTQSIGLAVWGSSEISPLRYIFLIGSYPESTGISEQNLRPLFNSLRRLIESSGDDGLSLESESDPFSNARKPLDDICVFWTDTNQPSLTKPAVFASFLSSHDGRRFSSWAKMRIRKCSGFQYTPLYYSCEFFRECDPFNILLDQTLKTNCRAGIAGLRELLEEGFKASKGFGAMYVLHLGWCSILLEEYEKLLDHIAFAREPSFSALSEYACELGLALWYEGKMDFAKEYFEKVACLGPVQSDWPRSFLVASKFFGCSELANTDLDIPSLVTEMDSWIGSMYLALSSNYDREAWGGPMRICPDRTKAMKDRAVPKITKGPTL